MMPLMNPILFTKAVRTSPEVGPITVMFFAEYPLSFNSPKYKNIDQRQSESRG
jgi:hypothetical protein